LKPSKNETPNINSINNEQMIEFQPLVTEYWSLTEEGLETVTKGSHEARVFNAIPSGPDGISIPDLQVGFFIHLN
jgi:phenylalanyl-tRNA synthetase alpha chain